jgi:hypothetical protein
MIKLRLIQWLNLGSQKIYWLIRLCITRPQILYWKFQGQGFYVRNKRNFSEQGWSLTSKSVNWGDLLLRELADEIYDISTIQKHYSGAVFGGSVLYEGHFKYIRRNSPKPFLAASCGARNSKDKLEIPPNLEIHGVRGLGTANLIEEAVPTGDPGMLAPVIFGIKPKVDIGFRKLQVPHFSQAIIRNSPRHDLLTTMLPYGKSSKSLVREINASNFVLAGSLHAGICAFATGTPFAFSLLDSTEDPFKYYDFASLYGIKIVFQGDFESAIRWYISEESLLLDRVPKDFEIFPGSLSKYIKFDLSNIRKKIEIHTKSRNAIHSLKVEYLRDYLKG